METGFDRTALEAFSPLPNRRGPSGISLALSAAAHVVAVGFLLLWRYIGPLEELRYSPKPYDVRIIHYSLPEPLLFASAGRAGGPESGGSAPKLVAPGGGRGPGPPARPAPKGPRASRPAPAPVETPAPEAPSGPVVAKPKFEPPPLAPRRPRDVVIQAEAPQIQIVTKTSLPNVFVWTQPEIRPPERHLKTFVPGEVKRVKPNPTALPDALPQLQVPNQQILVADLKIGDAPPLPKRPELPVFKATTSPIRVQKRALDAGSQLPVTPLPPGQPVNLLAILEQPAPPSSSYQVQAGNLYPSGTGGEVPGRGPGVGGDAGEGAAGAPGGAAGGANGTGSGRPGTGGGAATGGTGTGTGGAGTGAGGGAGGATGGGTGTGTGSGLGAGSARAGLGSGGPGSGAGTGTGTSGSGPGSRPGGAGDAIGITGLRVTGGVSPRTVSPNNSTFDIVVVHGNTREVLPESPGILTGQPIYTVYMPVPGSRREWVLQWAIPNSRPPVRQRTANTVSIGAVAPIRAPFPLQKAPLDLGEHRGRTVGRVVVYGSITDKGMVEDLRVIRGVRAEVDVAVVACLRQFVFRPAVRDGVPILVEALFGVPLD